MLQKTLSITMGSLLAFGGTAMAQEQYTADGYGPDAGSWELILGGSGSNDKDFDTGSFDLNAELGYYFPPELEAGLRQGIGFIEADDSSSAFSTAVFADYHFDFGAVRPFIGASIGYLYGEDVEETFTAGPEAGVKWYVKDETFIYGRATYEFLFEDTDDADNQFDDGRFTYVVGIGFNF